MLMRRVFNLLPIVTIAMLVVCTGILRGEIVVEIDSARRTIAPNGFTTYYVKVTNTEPAPIAIRARRVLDALPDTSWESSICTETHCYTPEEDVTDDQTVPAGKSLYFKVHVQAGKRIGDSATIGLRFESPSLVTWIERNLVVLVVESPLPDFLVDISVNKKFLEPGEENDFPIWITNPTTAPVSYRVRRVELIYPDTTWHSWLCAEDTCYAESVSETKQVEIPPDEYGFVRLKVIAGKRIGDRARVVLRFDSGDDVKVIDRLLEMEVYSTTAVPTGSTSGDALHPDPFPIPASTIVNVPLAGSGSGTTRTLQLFDLEGHRIADYSALARDRSAAEFLPIDVTRFPSGIYRSVLIDGNSVVTSQIIVRH